MINERKFKKQKLNLWSSNWGFPLFEHETKNISFLDDDDCRDSWEMKTEK